MHTFGFKVLVRSFTEILLDTVQFQKQFIFLIIGFYWEFILKVRREQRLSAAEAAFNSIHTHPNLHLASLSSEQLSVCLSICRAKGKTAKLSSPG